MWFLLKHSWKTTSVTNTSALSTVSVLVLLPLVWSVFEAAQWLALWQLLACQFSTGCSRALGSWADEWQIPGQLLFVQGSLQSLRPLMCVVRGMEAVLIGMFMVEVSGGSKGVG